MPNLIHPELASALRVANQRAIEWGHQTLEPEHVLLGLLHTPDSLAHRAMATLGLELEELKSAVRDALPDPVEHAETSRILPLSERAQAALMLAYLEAAPGREQLESRGGGPVQSDLNPGHVLQSLLRDTSDSLAILLRTRFAITYEAVGVALNGMSPDG